MAVPGAARYLQLVVSRSCGVGNTRLKSMVGICLPLAPQIMAQPLMWLMLITTAKGMYLMNGYSVVKDQAKGHPVDRLSPNVLKTGGVSTLFIKKIFQFGNSQVKGLRHRLMACTIQTGYLPGGLSLKHMKKKAPPLNIGKYARL